MFDIRVRVRGFRVYSGGGVGGRVLHICIHYTGLYRFKSTAWLVGVYEGSIGFDKGLRVFNRGALSVVLIIRILLFICIRVP